MSGASPIRARSTQASIPPIVDQDLWDQVQQSLGHHLGTARAKRTRQASEAPLAGKLFDDRGNRMSPTWARKGSRRWRYYVSQAALQGDKSNAGTIARVPAADVEAVVTYALSKLCPGKRVASQTDFRGLIDRVVIGRATIQIQLSEAAEADAGARTLVASVDAALSLSQTRDHPGRSRCTDPRPPDARQRARDPDRCLSRRPSLAGRTSVRSGPDPGSIGYARSQDRAFDPDDIIAGVPCAPISFKAAVEGRL